jgi:hypothetical protein
MNSQGEHTARKIGASLERTHICEVGPCPESGKIQRRRADFRDWWVRIWAMQIYDKE